MSITEEIRKRVVALAIDATCSLVVLGEDDQPVSVTPEDTTTVEEEGGEEDVPNVILWLDHRATTEAVEINAKGRAGREGSDGEDKAVASRLRFVGHNLSPENEVSKLLWLKRHLRQRVWWGEDEVEERKEKRQARGGEMGSCKARFWDLGDYLSYRVTKGEGGGGGGGETGGKDEAGEIRSLCCVASKWMYAHGEDGLGKGGAGGW
jgi:ribulose kinase